MLIILHRIVKFYNSCCVKVLTNSHSILVVYAPRMAQTFLVSSTSTCYLSINFHALEAGFSLFKRHIRRVAESVHLGRKSKRHCHHTEHLSPAYAGKSRSGQQLLVNTYLGQFQHRGFIAGYRFASEMHWHGEPEVLVPRAGEQLLILFEQYRQQINHWTRIRPGFSNHLLADLILSCLIKLQTMRPELDNGYIEQQAKLWLDAFHLSDKHLASLIQEETEGRLKHIRMSCCLAYKCRNGTLCQDCPRLSTNKR